jgi:hypothetical protein
LRFAKLLLALAVITVSGVGTVWLLKPGEAERLRKDKEQLDVRIAELQRSIERLTGEARLAEVHVLRQQQAPGGWPRPSTTIEFIELDRQGHPLPGRQFVINDRVIFFDALVLKFDHDKVAAGDALRGKSVALFRRVYGEHQKPADGFPVDPEGEVPHLYRIQPQPSDLERRLWARFWDYACDPRLAAQEGVRVAQGEAVYVPMKEGQVWSLSLQNDGGINIRLHRDSSPGQPASSGVATEPQ